MSEHTKEKWRVSRKNVNAVESAFLCNESANRATPVRIATCNREEDARRIVACVNACAGFSTENLEQNRPLLWLAQQYNETIRQREELLAALVEASKIVNEVTDYGEFATLQGEWRYLIASVGAGGTAPEGHNADVTGLAPAQEEK